MRHYLRLGATAVLGLSLSSPVFGAVIFEHEGDTPPNDALLGDFPTFIGNTSAVGPVDGTTDPGGLDAWNIDTSGNDVAVYQASGDQGDVAAGILLSIELQLLDDADPVDIGTQLQIRTGSRIYGMFFGRSGNDVTVNLLDDFVGATVEAQHTVTDGGGNYNLFQLLVDDAGQGELWVNGSKVDGITYDGFASNIGPTVLWGDAGGPENGNANYAVVRIETGSDAVIPEPASLALLAVGSLFLLPRRKSLKD